MLDLGIALLGVGAALLIAEAHVVSYGVLGATGLASMVIGAVLAVDAAGGSIALVLAIALTLALAGAAMLLAVVRRVAGRAPELRAWSVASASYARRRRHSAKSSSAARSGVHGRFSARTRPCPRATLSS